MFRRTGQDLGLIVLLVPRQWGFVVGGCRRVWQWGVQQPPVGAPGWIGIAAHSPTLFDAVVLVAAPSVHRSS